MTIELPVHALSSLDRGRKHFSPFWCKGSEIIISSIALSFRSRARMKLPLSSSSRTGCLEISVSNKCQLSRSVVTSKPQSATLLVRVSNEKICSPGSQSQGRNASRVTPCTSRREVKQLAAVSRLIAVRATSCAMYDDSTFGHEIKNEDSAFQGARQLAMASVQALSTENESC